MRLSPVPQRHPLSRALQAAILGLFVGSYTLPSLAQPSSAGHSSQVQQWNIAPGPLAPALDRFAREAGISLSFDAQSVANRNTAGVQEPQQAIQLMAPSTPSSLNRCGKEARISFSLTPCVEPNSRQETHSTSG